MQNQIQTPSSDYKVWPCPSSLTNSSPAFQSLLAVPHTLSLSSPSPGGCRLAPSLLQVPRKGHLLGGSSPSPPQLLPMPLHVVFPGGSQLSNSTVRTLLMSVKWIQDLIYPFVCLSATCPFSLDPDFSTLAQYCVPDHCCGGRGAVLDLVASATALVFAGGCPGSRPHRPPRSRPSQSPDEVLPG